jgi:hypothetical protein
MTAKKKASVSPEAQDKTAIQTIPQLMEDSNYPKIITPLTNLVSEYRNIDYAIKQFDEMHNLNTKDLIKRKAELRNEIEQTLKDRGELSVRLPEATLTLAVRKTAQITDESALVADLERRNLKDYYGVRVTELFKTVVLPEQGKSEKPLDGITIKETSYLSIRKAEDKKLTELPYQAKEIL